MTNIKINPIAKKIVLKSYFAKKALCVGSDQYYELQEAHKAYPDYSIEVRTIKKKVGKESYKGLTYEYMENFISEVDTTGAMMMAYNELRHRTDCHSNKYGHIKKWFLKNFPEVNSFDLDMPRDFTVEDFQKWKMEGVA